MGEATGIAWTDHTFNPWWGCDEVSPACDHCYARTFSRRMGRHLWGEKAERRFFGQKHWNEPFKWDAEAQRAGVRRRVFCASMADVFEDRCDLEAPRRDLWSLIGATPFLDWQLLTKRPENLRRLLPREWLYHPQSNVWLGTTVEDNARRDRIGELLDCPAVVHFVSAEPLLEDIDFNGYRPAWVIFGGESGSKRREMDLEHLRSGVDQARAAGAAIFVKQDSALRSGERGRIPEDLWIREFPRNR